MKNSFKLIILICFIPSQVFGLRGGKLLGAFNIVRYPNDPCEGDNNAMGTCYSAEECENKGGRSDGSCANGYGVCCVCKLSIYKS